MTQYIDEAWREPGPVRIRTIRQNNGLVSAGNRHCSLGRHSIPAGLRFDEWVGTVDDEFRHQTECWRCLRDLDA